MDRRRFLLASAALACVPTAIAAPKRDIKKALKYGMIGDGTTVLEKFQSAKAAGFEGVEIDSPSDLDQGVFGFWASPSQGVSMADVEVAMDAEIGRLLADGVDGAEVERVKTRLVREAVYARESLFAAARIFGTALSTGYTVADVEAWSERISAVTVDQVNAAARAVLVPETSVTGLLLPADGE